jgi:ATP-dependent Lhr-like helicase
MDLPFHPATARWFAETLGAPTCAQTLGWAAIREGRHTLIAAPTGSGKTLAAFLTALDDLLQEGLGSPLPDEVRVLYVSPLKALSADIHINLAEPRRGLRAAAEALGLEAPRITAAVRTGDTPQAERAAMLRRPPHVLVTTPESLYLLLTATQSREMLRTVRTVIVDEIHAVIGTRRGAHVALSLERLQQIADCPILRIGLSATQKPIEDVARFLVGASNVDAAGRPACTIVDEGHRRQMDLSIEVPGSPLEAVMAHEIWEEYYDRLAALISTHRTTLVFVNTRRLVERVTRHLCMRLGEQAVTAHHGSLSKEKRLDAERRLKLGDLKALVATASLELGIDIGSVDLACQIGSPHRIATFIQRIGRSGHTLGGTPKGRLFPTSRDDLVECAALLRAFAAGELDRIVDHDCPLDILTQQIVAEAACQEYAEEDLFTLARRAWPYRQLARADFDAAVAMAADGFATRRGRRAALLHRDEVNRRVRGRRGARLIALTSGGAIPEVADYRVVVDPEDTFIGTLNEDFAIESSAGDVFQLGNASWRVLQVTTGTVRVADAHGAPPTIPFWLGEAPARSDELSEAVSTLRHEIEVRLPPSRPASARHAIARDDVAASGGGKPDTTTDLASGFSRTVEWLASDGTIPRAAAEQIVSYLAESVRVLGALPTQDTLILERFFDESGGMQLVLHAPFGSRINKAWGLALRKRFCRQFNFELQAAATEDALMLSLGPQHSFPLADVFRYLHPATVRDVLVQAFLDAPVFQTRWRWNTTIALAVPRHRGGRKIPPQLQRMVAEDLMAAVFPDAAACLENIPGDRQIPDHPLVAQTVRDCLEEAMDFAGLTRVLEQIHRGELRLISRDTPEPSPLAHEILNARPYAFLDDAPLEERRAHAVQTRRAADPNTLDGHAVLDPAAIARVREEARPDPRDADELHDTLMTAAFLLPSDLDEDVAPLFRSLVDARRAATLHGLWVAAERLPELRTVLPEAALAGKPATPASRAERRWTRAEALIEIVRGRLTLAGPTTGAALAAPLTVSEDEIMAALLALEADGVVLRGVFTGENLEWCDRALLARIHRYTLNRLRQEIEPVSSSDFMRFLFVWQHVDRATRLTGFEGLRAAVALLDGFELPARAWERSVLPARLDRYQPTDLDLLCLTGEAGWARLSAPAHDPSAVGSTTPVALFLREHAPTWRVLRWLRSGEEESGPALSVEAQATLTLLQQRGALFVREIAAADGVDDEAAMRTLAELASAGLATSDGFAGLRAIVRRPSSGAASTPGRAASAGRWSCWQGPPKAGHHDDSARMWRPAVAGPSPGDIEGAVETQAWTLLRRYGIVFRRLLTREANAAPWRELARVYRRLEARGEIRGGHFVAGMSGEQFARPDAIERMREVRRGEAGRGLLAISAADPLNLTGIVTSGERVRAADGTRVAYRDGVPVAVMEGDYIRPLGAPEPLDAEVSSVLAGRRVPAVASGFVGR